MKESVRLVTDEDRETCGLVGVELRSGRSRAGAAEPVRLSAEESLRELAELAEGARGAKNSRGAKKSRGA